MGLYVNQCPFVCLLTKASAYRSDKWELFDSERDMADIGDEYFALENLDNKQNALH